MNGKKIIAALGPLLAACALLGALLFSPIKQSDKPSDKVLSKSAASMSVNVIRGNMLKNTAMATGRFIPFFGSSEYSRIDAFHPTVLARKYQRPYEPFLLGAAGTQSLTHFFMLQSMSKELQNKQAVFIISPQWFVKDGISDGMFSLYYSPLQVNGWLLSLEHIGPDEMYAADRLLSFSSIQSDTTMKTYLKKIAGGSPLSDSEKAACQRTYRLLSREDALFSRINLKNKEEKIAKAVSKLPDDYNQSSLDKLAVAEGKRAIGDNQFGISTHFYQQRIAPMKKKLKGAQQKYNYLQSPEYADFQLVLDELAKNNVNVLFVIPPVNGKWSDYTGLSTEMLDTFSKKIKKQLTSQGFTNIADFTQQRYMPYFMEDTIHLGWRGWLATDRALQEFLNKPADGQLHYHTAPAHYLSKDWCNDQAVH